MNVIKGLSTQKEAMQNRNALMQSGFVRQVMRTDIWM